MACGGAAAAFAVNFTHPIELVKTRMQASGGSIGATMGGVMKEGGVSAFWKGLPFGWGRELSYTSVKLGACKFDVGCRSHLGTSSAEQIRPGRFRKIRIMRYGPVLSQSE